MITILKSSLSLLLLLTAFVCRAQNNVKSIDSLMKGAYQRGIFNGNILVAKNGQLIYQNSLGYADGNKSLPLTADMKFDIGSISKEFNGVAIMLLRQRGMLFLDDNLSKYFPEFGSWAHRVQVKHLINYTSGIPVLGGGANDSDSLIYKHLLELKTLTAQPGSIYIYNNINVYLQRRIIEKVSSLSYSDFITKNLLIPAGMTRSAVDYPVNAKGMARAFDSEGRDVSYEQKMTGWVRLPIGDFYKWTKALHSGQLISLNALRELGQNFPGGESSLGSAEFKGDTLIWHQHQGSNSNYEAAIYSYLPEDITIVLMTNHQEMKVLALKSAIMNILQNKPFTIPKKSLYLSIRDKMLFNTDDGIRYYQMLKANGQELYDFGSEAGDLISAAKYLQRRSKLDGAVKVLQIAVKLKARPQDISYGYELIGDCYRFKGDKKEALKNYKSALNVFPGNTNAQGMINQLTIE